MLVQFYYYFSVGVYAYLTLTHNSFRFRPCLARLHHLTQLQVSRSDRSSVRFFYSHCLTMYSMQLSYFMISAWLQAQTFGPYITRTQCYVNIINVLMSTTGTVHIKHIKCYIYQN